MRLVTTNARRQAEAVVEQSEEIKRRVQEGRLWVVPAVYDSASGRVRFLPRVEATSAARH